MGKWTKLREKIRLGDSDASIPFDDLCHVPGRYGFTARTRAGHRRFFREGVEEILNLQPNGAQAKDYQVAQVVR